MSRLLHCSSALALGSHPAIGMNSQPSNSLKPRFVRRARTSRYEIFDCTKIWVVATVQQYVPQECLGGFSFLKAAFTTTTTGTARPSKACTHPSWNHMRRPCSGSLQLVFRTPKSWPSNRSGVVILQTARATETERHQKEKQKETEREREQHHASRETESERE